MRMKELALVLGIERSVEHIRGVRGGPVFDRFQGVHEVRLDLVGTTGLDAGRNRIARKDMSFEI